MSTRCIFVPPSGHTKTHLYKKSNTHSNTSSQTPFAALFGIINVLGDF